jgi:hypothetical protein
LGSGLIWPHVNKLLGPSLCRNSKATTIAQAAAGQAEGVDFLMQISLKQIAKVLIKKMDAKWEEEAVRIRTKRFKKLNPESWRTSPYCAERKAALVSKYGGNTLQDMKTQRALYWLSIDQIIPPALNFRVQLSNTHDLDWSRIDRTKLFKDSRMQAFQWRSTHGKLYARKDLVRFGYIQEQNCSQCHEPVQTIKHVFTECIRNQWLFANYERHYKLTEKLTHCEKLIGMDTSVNQTLLQLKQLNLLRRCIYDAVHAETILKWEEVLKCIDKLYVIEYAIADRNNTILKHLRNWEV